VKGTGHAKRVWGEWHVEKNGKASGAADTIEPVGRNLLQDGVNLTMEWRRGYLRLGKIKNFSRRD